MPKDSLEHGEPEPFVEPGAPLLRAHAAIGHVVASEEVVIRSRPIDQFQVLLHTTQMDASGHQAESSCAFQQVVALRPSWRRSECDNPLGLRSAVFDELVDRCNKPLQDVGKYGSFLRCERAEHVGHQLTSTGVDVGVS